MWENFGVLWVLWGLVGGLVGVLGESCGSLVGSCGGSEEQTADMQGRETSAYGVFWGKIKKKKRRRTVRRRYMRSEGKAATQLA